jgi:hypothetical protein
MGFPISVDEDTVIVAGMKESILTMELQRARMRHNPGIKDISAVEYRIAFKQAIQIALTVSQETLQVTYGKWFWPRVTILAPFVDQLSGIVLPCMLLLPYPSTHMHVIAWDHRV